MSGVERALYQDLEAGTDLAQLKREYQRIYGINARQFNSIYATLKGKIRSRAECHKRQLKQLRSQITDLEKLIKKWKKQLLKIPLACPLQPDAKTPRQSLRWKLHQKPRRLHSLRSKLAQLTQTKPRLIFGGRKLWTAQYNLESNGFVSHEQWLNQWQQHRNSQFYCVGFSDETNGCQICQLSADDTLKIRVAPVLEAEFGQYVQAEGIRFAYGQNDIDWARENHKAISYRFAQKNEQWYVFATVERPAVPHQSHRRNGCLGVDLNPGVIGWSYCDAEGNLKAHGQFRVTLQDKTTQQTKAIVGDVCAQLVGIAQSFGCPIVIERLDFERKKASMREQGVRYARMLSNFAYSLFDAMLFSRCERFGIELIRVNPAYSSLIGLVKFMQLYGLSSDTAAALVLARRALHKSERIPAKSASCLPVERHKHVWSFWNALSKKLKGMRRHSFFTSVAYSESEVSLFDKSARVDRSDGKPLALLN
ncbi:mobile element protein [Leptolyngbya sp. NIES-2104]|nr:mobile element protein [Leptolyngbya sp. NIES-2104]